MSESISVRAWKGTQSWNYERIEEIKGVKVRLTIKRDAYVFQSRGLAEVWAGIEKGWTRIHLIPGEGLRVAGHYTSASPPDFAADVDELRRVALAVLGG